MLSTYLNISTYRTTYLPINKKQSQQKQKQEPYGAYRLPPVHAHKVLGSTAGWEVAGLECFRAEINGGVLGAVVAQRCALLSGVGAEHAREAVACGRICRFRF